MDDVDALKELHLINSLFSSVTGNDLFFAAQIKGALEFALKAGGSGCSSAPRSFEESMAILHKKLHGNSTGHAFRHIDAGEFLRGSGPLWLHGKLVALFQNLPKLAELTIVITNVAGGSRPQGRRWTKRAKHEYAELIGHIRRVAARCCPVDTPVTLLFF